VEYWSRDIGGIDEFPHKILTGIKLEKTVPVGSIMINNGDVSTTSTSVLLSLSSNSTSGVSVVRFSNDGVWDTEVWENATVSRAWNLTSGDGSKTVYYQVRDNAGLTSSFSAAILLQSTTPTPSPSPSPSPSPTPAPTSTPTPSPAPTNPPSATPTPTPRPTASPSPLPSQTTSPTPVAVSTGFAVEYVLAIVGSIVAVMVLLTVFFLRKKKKRKHQTLGNINL
jgi:hypothetical protein